MNANQGGVFAMSQRSDALLEDTRRVAAAFLNARSPDKVMFGANMTTLTYAVSRAIGREPRPGDRPRTRRHRGAAVPQPHPAGSRMGGYDHEAVPEDTPSVADFYDGLAPDYHLVYGGDWDGAVERWGTAVDALIRSALPGASAVLDCSCGIGTQAIGLARRGYRVLGTDLSRRAIERARHEAARLGATVSFDVADFRDLRRVPGLFDVVISCDNAIPHLMTRPEVTEVLGQMKGRLRPGGLVLITIRDFDRALREKPPVAPPAVIPGPPRRLLLRVHDWDPAGAPFYTVRLLVLMEGAGEWTVVEHTSRYRAIPRQELTSAAQAVGLSNVQWRSEEGVLPVQQQVMMAINPG